MYRVAICENEEFHAKEIEQILTQLLREKSVKFKIEVFMSGEELCDKLETVAYYDMIFLDIELGEMNGIEVAEKIKEVNESALIAFISAFVKYGPIGSRIQPFRYMLKEELHNGLSECLDSILITLRKRKIKFRFSDGEQIISVDSIVYIASEGRRLAFNLVDKQMDSYQQYMNGKLDDIEEKLKNYGFIRIHRSYLVNVSYIKKVANYKAVLRNGIEYGEYDNKEGLPIPREKYKDVKKNYFEKVGGL